MKIRKVLVSLLIASTAFFLLSSCESPELSQAKVYFQREDIEQGKEELMKAKEKYPENPEVHFLLASNVYLPKGKTDKANKALDRAIELDPTYKEKASLLKKKLWAQHQNQAINDYNKSEDAIMPETQDSLLEESISKFKKALAISDTSEKTYLGITQAHYSKEDTAGVQKYAAQAMEKGIFNENILNFYAATLEDPQNGLKEINSILERHPEYTSLKVQKAQFLIDLENFDEAEKTITKVLDENPEHTIARFLLGNLYMEQDSTEKAQQTYDKILEKNQDNINMILRIAQNYFKAEEYRKAVKYSRQCITAIQQQDNQDRKNLAGAYEILWKSLYNLGETERAKQMRKKAQQL